MTVIPASDPNILYSPYTWLVSGGRAKTINSGAYLRMVFDGDPNTLSAQFDVAEMYAVASRIGFRVDGGPWQDYPVAASVNLTVPTNNTWDTHTLEMVVVATSELGDRWATQKTAVIFTGITGDVPITTRPTRARPRYGIALGDSITEGVRTLNATASGDVNRNDSRLAWAYPLAEMLGAEIGVVGFGATGISRAGSGGVPKFPDSAPFLWAGQARNLSTRPPDFVALHIGTNDGSSTDTNVTTDTAALLNYFIANTPPTTPIVVMAGWVQTKAAPIRAGIDACSAPSRVKFIDTTGWWNPADAADALHPYGYANIGDLSYRVAAAIAGTFATGGSGTGKTFIRSATGEAIPVETHLG